MQFEGIKKPTKNVEVNLVTSKPKISKKTQQIAEEKRKNDLKKAGLSGEKVDIVTLLMNKDALKK